VKENEIKNIKKCIRTSLEKFNEFHVKIEGLKLIPNERHIRVIGLKVESKELSELIKTIVRGVGGSFHTKQKITICRVKKVSDKEALKNFIKSNINVKVGKFHVNNVALVKSELTKNGPKYQTIEKIKLKSNE
jgi:2'-5' RNA ligase